MLFELFLSLVLISLVSLIGVFTLSINHKKLERFLELIVAFAVGALLGDVFIHLLPELGENGFSLPISLTILMGILCFFVLEKIIHWHHCHRVNHTPVCAPSFGYVSLAGDALHNFIDGVILVGAFIVSPTLGIATAIAVLLHEVPQEIADFGILLKSGFSQKKALVYNFLVSLTAFLGAGIALTLTNIIELGTSYLIAFTVGGFLYLVGTDLLPELHKKFSKKATLLQFVFVIIGILLMLSLLLLE